MTSPGQRIGPPARVCCGIPATRLRLRPGGSASARFPCPPQTCRTQLWRPVRSLRSSLWPSLRRLGSGPRRPTHGFRRRLRGRGFRRRLGQPWGPASPWARVGVGSPPQATVEGCKRSHNQKQEQCASAGRCSSMPQILSGWPGYCPFCPGLPHGLFSSSLCRLIVR